MSMLTRRHRIVVALDFSEYAEIVLEHALDLANRHDMPDLHFVHVMEHEGDDLVDAKNQLAELVLESLSSFADHAPKWHARLHVRQGKPEEEIVALAAEVDADVIVIGRFGLHRPRKRLGSVAYGVIADATCPVLAVNLVERPIDTQPQCADCARVREESDGERWFCEAHSGDRPTMATTTLPTSVWTGGTLMW